MHEQLTIFGSLKACSECRDVLPLSAAYFHRAASAGDGFHNICKECRNAAKRKTQVRNNENLRAWRARWKGLTPEEILAKQQEIKKERERKVQQTGAERWESLSPERKAKYLAHARKYHWENRQQILERKRKYNTENPKQRIEWRNANRERDRAAVQRYRCRAMDAPGSHTAEDVADIYLRQGGKCAYCQKGLNETYHVDHIVPLSRGGSNDPSNLCCACVRCNCSKRDRTGDEYRVLLS